VSSIRRIVAVTAFYSFAACAGGHGGSFVPSSAPSAQARSMSPAAEATPSNGAGALPGNGAGALPGASVPCTFSPSAGQANCTIAVSLRVPPIPNPETPAALIPGLQPSDLRSMYALPYANRGTTVAIVDAFDDPSAESDLGAYRAAFGETPCTSRNGCFKKVNQSGATGAYPAADAAWSQEIALDVEMVSAVCPNCTILLVEANSASVDDLGAGVDEAVRLGARVVSNSYYATEWAGETSEDVHYRHPGVAVTVSSGDQAAPFYPAASPYVTAVGGTSVAGSPGARSETPWSYGGRGCSAYEARPSFQRAVPCRSRASVDVAAVADPQTGVAAFSTESGGWVVAGGTSVGAPLVAAAYALGQPQGASYAYAHPTAFHDIAPAGYDLATGLGSPNGTNGL
jgi:hypothetical protein